MTHIVDEGNISARTAPNFAEKELAISPKVPGAFYRFS
jgi:hypothetical protein